MLILTWIVVSAVAGWLLCEREWLNSSGNQVLDSYRHWRAERRERAEAFRHDPPNL
jgi:hypothetical protein